MKKERTVLLIENDSPSKRCILSRFVEELSKNEEALRYGIRVLKLGLNEIPAEDLQADLILLEPPLASLLIEVEKLVPQPKIVDIMDLFAYGTGNSALALEQMIDLLENGKKKKRQSGSKEYKFAPTPVLSPAYAYQNFK